MSLSRDAAVVAAGACAGLAEGVAAVFASRGPRLARMRLDNGGPAHPAVRTVVVAARVGVGRRSHERSDQQSKQHQPAHGDESTCARIEGE